MSAPLHNPPRHPHTWLIWLPLSQLVVAAIWWRWGWAWGLPTMLLSHLPILWGTLKPDSRIFGPVLRRLPIRESRVWLTIDDGPSSETAAMLDLLDRHQA